MNRVLLLLLPATCLACSDVIYEEPGTDWAVGECDAEREVCDVVGSAPVQDPFFSYELVGGRLDRTIMPASRA